MEPPSEDLLSSSLSRALPVARMCLVFATCLSLFTGEGPGLEDAKGSGWLLAAVILRDMRGAGMMRSAPVGV